ncbi:LuxR C-terminal-related transcriptional regulator [Nocardioides nitrophenolicus]|uniref:LuxR C-terminal-related transcriptional regulator n=1 Tax=Nocardioides nitrophenolicus TaxID=60489 RepID=UPI00195EC013|nr:LuxR C-terminal-related transcriptional regulator [Nocardioides nitrophenolicus]MBM7517310.1 DNA-binding CsgD family transcriptional regulator [Nocardioides nitrophenolicus]
MTWSIHERLRIIRVVEAVAAVDMSGALPWREEWSTYFGGPVGLLAALRAHGAHGAHGRPAPPEPEDDDLDDLGDDRRIRRSALGVRAILDRYDAAGSTEPVLLRLTPRRRPGAPMRARRTSTVELTTLAAARLDRLSRRQRRVLELVALGQSEAAIAAVLVLRPETVAELRAEAFRTLGLTPSRHLDHRLLAILTLQQAQGVS